MKDTPKRHAKPAANAFSAEKARRARKVTPKRHAKPVANACMSCVFRWKRMSFHRTTYRPPLVLDRIVSGRWVKAPEIRLLVLSFRFKLTLECDFYYGTMEESTNPASVVDVELQQLWPGQASNKYNELNVPVS